jgi:hypothetical protein
LTGKYFNNFREKEKRGVEIESVSKPVDNERKRYRTMNVLVTTAAV